LRGGWGIKHVETMVIPSSKKNVPGDSILNKKMKGVKLNKDVIINCKFLHRKEIASDRRDTKHIKKANMFRGVRKKRCLANVSDAHT
jgi:hypothetical protein